MGKILCFVTDDFADFEITLALHLIRNIGKREVLSIGYDLSPVISQSGLQYKPDLLIKEAIPLDDIEGLILPGGPIRAQKDELTNLIKKLDRDEKLLAAICFGPQYLGRAGVLDNTSFTTSCSIETINSLDVVDPFPRENYVDKRIVRDGHRITAHGLAFIDFAFELLDFLHVFQGNEQERNRLFHTITNGVICT